MIVERAQLPTLSGQVAMVDGGFDPIHAGHVTYFEAAAALGHPVFCNVSPDSYVETKHPVLLPEFDRARVLDAFRWLDYVYVSHGTTVEVLEELRPRCYVKGSDWRGRLPGPERELCSRYGIEIVYLDTVTHSSSDLLSKIPHRIGVSLMPLTLEDYARRVRAWEESVLDQRAVPAEHYDDEYFTADWREGDNRYDLGTRRRIEDRNPRLIKEVFAPSKVLDVGCGPGFLMYFLHELGVECDGVDFSPRIRELAPPEVREKIIIAPVTRPQVPEASYDLVICREVMEHLSVVQVQKTVQAICDASSRYVYVTTRFHPEPEDLLDFTTQFEVDPSHITLLNKELLRSLFVLQGFRSRPDLEERMDWAGKDRVIVAERTEAADA